MSHTLTEGGQITSHRLRMLKQVLKTTFQAFLLMTLAVFVWKMTNIPKINYVALWHYGKAWIFNGVVNQMDIDPDFARHVAKLPNAQSLPVESVMRLSAPYIQRLSSAALENLYNAAQWGVLGALVILAFFFYRGRLSKSKKHLSGPKTVSARWIRWKLKLQGKASKISIGPLPLVKGTETQHMMITGGTGSGKTNCLHHLLIQIRATNQKAVIIDTTGEFAKRYYREGKDIILNPFDARSAQWSPWAEGTSPADYASLAEAFIPPSYSENENYWRLASKTVFISLLERFADKKNTSELIERLQYDKLIDLCNLLAHTKAAAHMDANSEKTASSVRSVATTHLECLGSLKDTSTPFSIRDWVAKKDDSWLFLQCTPSERALLRPLLAAWLSSAVRGLISMPIDLKRRIWFAIDELPTLQKVKDIEVLLTEGRKYGGCAILSLQSPAQLESIYGREVAKVIIGNTSTKVVFQERDPEIADRISRAFGECEVQDIQEGISYGAHEARDGVNLSKQNKFRPVVSATQILSLPTNKAYIRLGGQNLISSSHITIAKKISC